MVFLRGSDWGLQPSPRAYIYNRNCRSVFYAKQFLILLHCFVLCRIPFRVIQNATPCLRISWIPLERHLHFCFQILNIENNICEPLIIVNYFTHVSFLEKDFRGIKCLVCTLNFRLGFINLDYSNNIYFKVRVRCQRSLCDWYANFHRWWKITRHGLPNYHL